MLIRDARSNSSSLRIGQQRTYVRDARAIHGADGALNGSSASEDSSISSSEAEGVPSHRFSVLLNQCSCHGDLSDGLLLHFILAEHAFDTIPSFANRLLRMYALCGSCYDARSLFESMHPKDPHSWRYVIKAAWNVNDSLQLFQQMMMECFLPVYGTFMSILSACTGASSLLHGMHFHACIAGSEFLSDINIGNSILNMYNKCGSLEFAVEFYEDMLGFNVITFNTMITTLVQHNETRKALEFYRQMQLQAVSPSGVTFISIVSACTALAQIDEGKRLHALGIYSDFAFDVTLNNSVLNMYGKCGSFIDAERLFWAMASREVVTWNCMITSLVLHKRYGDAYQLFRCMEAMGPLPNNATFTNILSTCACKASLPEVKRMHLWVVGTKLETDVVLGTALVTAYSKCDGLEEALKVFRHMSSQDAILWNAMIEAYVKADKSRDAIELFEEMQANGVTPTSVTFVVLLDASMILEESRHMHKLISHHGFDANPVVGTSLMNLFTRCCSLGDVHEVFDKMPEHDLFSWNAFIAGISKHCSIKEACCAFQMMWFEGVIPNCVSFINLCDSCDTTATSKEAKQIHAMILASTLEEDAYVVKSIIAMYGRVGNFEQAQRVFEENRNHNEITCNAMIVTCSQSSQAMKAISVYRQMQVEGIQQGRFTMINLIFGFVHTETILEGRRVHATVVRGPFEKDLSLTNSFLNMYGKCGRLEEARTLFEKAHDKDVYSWSAMLAAYVQRNEGWAAFMTFNRMLLECVLPDKITFISMVSGCANRGFIAEGKQMHVCILETGFKSDLNLLNALINMYGKCGSIKASFEVFNNLQSCNVLSWNALLSVYALHGHGKETLRLYNKMQEQNVVPDEVTYSIVLSACSHSGLLKEGLECFATMSEVNGVKPTEEHITCVINLLCRVGLLDEGENIVKVLLSQPSSVTWTTILGFCKMHCDDDRGKRLASDALQLEPKNSSLYVLLSNIYASSAGTDETIDQRKKKVMMQSFL